ncbi:unnamed protein product [Fraxinus pennsylvanica]|uniref:V-type proton ATPase subunit G n=1 Tax=Fraxinus pennsylvanica TaxID=56036 RepID=A0AAD2E2B7_9LAMI|nr:unnamed protein product [Fraxinus pennsylvanica]
MLILCLYDTDRLTEDDNGRQLLKEFSHHRQNAPVQSNHDEAEGEFEDSTSARILLSYLKRAVREDVCILHSINSRELEENCGTLQIAKDEININASDHAIKYIDSTTMIGDQEKSFDDLPCNFMLPEPITSPLNEDMLFMRVSSSTDALNKVKTASAPSYCPNSDSSIISMASSSGQNGIQLLLAAEQEAQHIVNAARTAKQARLKQAKEEAEKEIAEFRAQMEADFQRKVAESSGDSGANVKRLERETDAKIQHLKTEASRISHDVVQMLLRHVTTVKN